MKLNPDCVRDILLTAEEVCDPDTALELPDDLGDASCARLRTYSERELMYHIKQCDLTGLLYNARCDILGSYFIPDLTPKAHEFLANIRQDATWGKIKKAAESAGSTSLGVLVQIAAKVIGGMITGQM